MTSARRATILKLAKAAYEIDLDVINGLVTHDKNGQWKVGNQDLEALLAGYEGQELVLIVGSLADVRPVETRTCLTCGRDYVDVECPHCRASRIRLRGTP
jgi:hypothetical protein